MQNQIYFFVLISILPSLAMSMQMCENQTDADIFAKASHIKEQLFNAAGSPTSIITGIRKYLKDQSLASAGSRKVQAALVDMLATQVLRKYSSTRVLENMNEEEMRITTYWDGTLSFKEIEHIYPLDMAIHKTICKKPLSTWYQLSFEEFLRSFYQFKKEHE